MTQIEQLLNRLINQARETGIARISTCHHVNWSKEEHDGMLMLQIHPPDDITITYEKNHGVCDWTLIRKGTQAPDLSVFDAYQHFLFYFEQGRYKEVAPHGPHMTQHFSDKLDGLRNRKYKDSGAMECNDPEVLVKWIQDMTHDNQAIIIDYMMKYHRNEDGTSKWGRKL